MLTARTSALPSWAAGHVSFLIEFTTDSGEVHRSTARVACVTAVPFDGTIRIDGDLSDWPPGAANVASGFRLVSWEAAEPLDERATQPEHATMALMMRDEDHLYVAVNGMYDGRVAGLGSRRNTVEYDDLIPVGEELVEVLIDPLNSGTRSPADLYHIVVKPSGSYLTERGIRFDPPCGPWEPWPAAVEIATRTHPTRWTAELRIPLASFGEVGTDHAFWGLNVTRYGLTGEEFSTWSGASGNAYDPLSLGNLYLP
jgi:hypothetical protein